MTAYIEADSLDELFDLADDWKVKKVKSWYTQYEHLKNEFPDEDVRGLVRFPHKCNKS